jgi:hypothetical protein
MESMHLAQSDPPARWQLTQRGGKSRSSRFPRQRATKAAARAFWLGIVDRRARAHLKRGRSVGRVASGGEFDVQFVALAGVSGGQSSLGQF